MTESRLLSQLDSLQNIDAVQAMLAGAQVLKEKCVEIVAVDTGHLRDSGIADELAPSERGAFVSFGGGEYDVNYATYVEFGNNNPNYPIQPYMRPSVDNNMDEIAQAVGNQISGQMRNLVR